MKTLKTRKELKQEVKDLYRNNWGKARIALIPVAIITLIFNIIQIISRNPFLSLSSKLFLLLVMLLILIVSAIIGNNTMFYLWDWQDGQHDLGSIFNKKNLLNKKYLTGNILISLFIFLVVIALCLIIGIVFGVVRVIFPGDMGALLILILIIPATIFAFYIILQYVASLFIYKAEMCAGQKRTSYFSYLGKSRHLMRGNKWRYCVLLLSMLGWNLLVALIYIIVALVIVVAVFIIYPNTLIANIYSIKILLWFIPVMNALTTIFLSPYLYGIRINFFRDLIQTIDD